MRNKSMGNKSMRNKSMRNKSTETHINTIANTIIMNASILQQKFISQDNKRILWELMTEHKMFDGVADIHANNVKLDFERLMQQTAVNIPANETILSVNKQIIMQMLNEVKKYKQGPVTSADLGSQKQAKFQRGVESKQAEFNSLIQPVKPMTIDFADKLNDEPIGDEMETKLAQTIAWREQQLRQVLDKQGPVDTSFDTSNEASDWLTKGQLLPQSLPQSLPQVLSNKDQSLPQVNRNIKIGDTTSIEEKHIINIKKVSFAEHSETSTEPIINFMDKLKKKDVNEEMKIDIAAIKTDMASIKNDCLAELASIKNDCLALLAANTLLADKQEQLLDTLEKLSFQFGSI